MALSIEHWHNRFTQQARWTQQIRHHLYQRFKLGQARRVLDVGCGTGVLSAELLNWGPAEVHGIDIQPDHLQSAARHAPQARFTLADAHHLPYSWQSFEVTLCHFVLLWVSDPAQMLREMTRVTRSGGVLLALAEPDYGGYVAYPGKLSELGCWQAEALQKQGADPYIGRSLRHLFREAGLRNIESGVLGGQWAASLTRQEWEMEWSVLESDLSHDPARLRQANEIKSMDARAQQLGDRILFVPTFYACGQVP